MRAKELKIVVAFQTTSEAIAMETACEEEGIPGRLIPVPRQISSGCGLAWAMPVEWEGDIGSWMSEKGLNFKSLGQYFI